MQKAELRITEQDASDAQVVLSELRMQLVYF